MKITYDKGADAVYIYLARRLTKVDRTETCDPTDDGSMINFDFDSAGKLVGIEILDARILLRPETLSKAGRF